MIIYRGPSKLDGSPIVAIVTGHDRPSQNPKTGPMVQTWILRADVHPAEALATGADSAVCGTCPLRPGPNGRACYVTLNPIAAVWRTYRDGRYPEVTPADAGRAVAGRAVRLGSYGDPAAVPVRVWRALLRHAKRHTGYTHAWAHPAARALRGLAMASTETAEGTARAQRAGWRAFRVRRADSAVLPGEIVCPASDESGHKSTCERCGLCNGAGPDRSPKSIVIIAHGATGAAVFNRRVAE